MSKVIMSNGGFTVDWLKRKVFQRKTEKETAQTCGFMFSLSFSLNTVNLNQVVPNYYYP